MRLVILALLCVPLFAQNGLNATNMTGNQIKLDWQASSGLTNPQYLVERCQGNGCVSFSQIAVLPPGTATYVDSGLAHYTYYTYRVRATDGTNFSAYGRTAAAVTVDLVLQSTTGDRCTAVTSLGSNSLVTFTCNQGPLGSKPGLRTTTTINNVNSVSNGLGNAFLSLAGSITCLVAVNEDPANTVNASVGQTINPGPPPTSTMILLPLPPGAIGYSCSVDGSAPVIQGVWALPTTPPAGAKRSLLRRAASMWKRLIVK